MAAATMTIGAGAQTWIWYPGDYEIWLGNEMNNRRTDRGAYFPPFWKQDSHYVTVEFSTEVDLAEAEDIEIATEGDYNIKVDGKMAFGMPKRLKIEAGRHKICVKVHNQSTPPTLYVSGRTIKSGAGWRVTYEDKEWIDESGKASDTSATTYMEAGSWNFDEMGTKPSEFRLKRERREATKRVDGLYDFGKETFGYLNLHGMRGDGEVTICYGESPEEASDEERCETLDRLTISGGVCTDMSTGEETATTGEYTLGNSKAFRYISVKTAGNVEVGGVSMEYEYMPEEARGTFRCSDELVNKMWEVGQYTLQLTTREFFIDGIKRDRWVWSGDASQSYLMNYYLFFDSEEVKRTTWLLGGKAPVSSHINTIMDYTFYWFISVWDYYMYTGDKTFLSQIYPTMRNLMEFVNSRRDAEGMVVGMTGDWVFVDWADKPMDKQGQLSFEQILFRRAIESMANVAKEIGETSDATELYKQSEELAEKFRPCFWDDKRKAIVHNRRDGKKSEEVFKFSNMFAIIFDYLTAEEKDDVMQNVMLNEDVLKITTPYMRFYEMEALCKMGMQEKVMSEMKDYWGGMIKEGATTFWEKYVPSDKGREHLSMYGRPYGKSLCHAWGASPIYLLGRYYMGVEPTRPGYEEYEVRPQLGGLEWMEGDVPTPFGKIHIRMDRKQISVTSDGGHGRLTYGGEEIEIPAGKTVTMKIRRH